MVFRLKISLFSWLVIDGWLYLLTCTYMQIQEFISGKLYSYINFVFTSFISCNSFFQVLKITRLASDKGLKNSYSFLLKEATSLHEVVNSLLLPCNFKFKLLR